MQLRAIFKVEKPVIGMVHLPPLPGSPENRSELNAIRQTVLRDAEALVSGGVDGLMVENFGDVPFYSTKVPPHTVAFMTVLGREIAAAYPLPLGINVLRNDARSALAIASAIGAAFIRVNIYTGARLTDQGIIQGEAFRLLRYRKLLGSSVKVFADVAVKHSAALASYNLADEVKDTVLRGRADAIIVSGSATGRETHLEDVKIAKAAAMGSPVLVGSGVTPATVNTMLAHADGLIVGTAFKSEGVTTNPVDRSLVLQLMNVVRETRKVKGM
jgi:membrane complex biogenesis BtpA family protein